MYNVVNIYRRIRKQQILAYSLLLNGKEFESITTTICFSKDADGFFAPKNDNLTMKERTQILKIIPSFQPIGDETTYGVSLTIPNQGVFFTLQTLIDTLLYPLFPGASPILGEMVVPINNRPTFLNYHYNIWHNQIGIIERLTKRYKNIGFIHPATNRLLFYDLSEYDHYRRYIKNLKKMLREKKTVNEIKKNKRFVRIISVYDKQTKKLKYRILNTEFDQYAIGYYALTPVEGDEGIFLRSYEIDKKIYKAIKTFYKINFDFENSSYFFETLDADEFVYPYQKLLKMIKQ